MSAAQWELTWVFAGLAVTVGAVCMVLCWFADRPARPRVVAELERGWDRSWRESVEAGRLEDAAIARCRQVYDKEQP